MRAHDVDPDDEPDTGLSVERTDLAWNRSGLALLACLALVARRFFPLDTRADQVAAYVLLGVGGLGWAVSLLVGRRTRHARHGVNAVVPLRMITASTVTIAIAAFVADLFPPED